ncbi:MAG: DUF3179 domain-containing protein [Armatimonadetes bacterium]|nr:DUF3179 domain-containing protein [Armatimonadota bacterium]
MRDSSIFCRPDCPAATGVVVLVLLASLGVALGVAGMIGQSSATAARAGVSGDDDWRPTPVVVVNGWVAAGRQDPTPAFEVSNCAVIAEIYRLGPGRDALPALVAPTFVPAAAASWLADEEPVLGLKMGDVVRCYPLAVLNWHSLVHDRIAGQAVYVFWDPPSGLGLARRVWASERPLGLAGLGYRGIGLAYERRNGALWDLFDGIPISYPGKPAGFRPDLRPDHQWLPLERMTWGAWRRLHASTEVLSRDTGYAADYATDPYGLAAIGPGGAPESYWLSDSILAPESLRDPAATLPDKDWVLGFLAGEEAWAVSLRELVGTGQKQVTLTTASGPMVVKAWPADDRFLVQTLAGQTPPQVRLFWFAWRARFADTRVWRPTALEH